VNDDQVAKAMHLPGSRFRGGGDAARLAAVVEIQAGARRMLAIREAGDMSRILDAAKKMTRRWQTKKMWQGTADIYKYR